VLLTGVGGVWAYYLRTRKPLPEVLPPAPVIAQALKPHYLFSIYGVDQPIGVAVTPRGDRIYVTESGGERLIKVFDRDGNLLISFKTPEENLGRAPVYPAVGPDGRVYISERRYHTVYIYDAEGNLQGELSPPTGEDFWSPLGLTFTDDRLYITDVTKDEHRILIYDLDGTFQMAFGKEGKKPGEFWFPNAVEVDQQGRIYVSDSNNGRVQVFDAQGQLLLAVRGFNLPRGMAIDSMGRLYVVDTVGQVVRVYDTINEPLRPLFEFGDFGISDGEFNYPNDIAVDLTGRLYIADRENNRIQVWSY